MGKLNLTSDDNGVMIYRNDKTSKAGNPYTTYSIRLSAKKYNSEEWDSSFLDVNFKKGVEVGNKAVINIKSSFLAPNNYGERQGLKLVILEFETIKDGEDAPKGEANDDFMNIPDSDDDELPFD